MTPDEQDRTGVAVTPGTHCGHYQIEEFLGRGGMGVVFSARDVELDRRVALKFLSVDVDDTAIERFRREAQTLASLDHDNIAVIHGIETWHETRFLVLELVEGLPLSEILADTVLPLERVVDIALQICGALEAAHEFGVVHRDLKPGNIVLAPDGNLKLLDFGLAKSSASALRKRGDKEKEKLTQDGMFPGTPAYMSPEQIRGEDIDEQTDIWAFGCVLYEMLAGVLAFEGTAVPDVVASVLTTTPDWTKLASNLPTDIQQIIKRCLNREKRNRYHSIGDVRIDLQDALSVPESVRREVATPPAGRTLFLWLAPLTVAASLGVAGWFLIPSPDGAVIQTLVSAPTGSRAFPSVHRDVDISDDGSRIIVRSEVGGSAQFYMRELSELAGRPIDASGAAGVVSPSFSPDGDWLVFGTYNPLSLRKQSASGRETVWLSELPGTFGGASWGRDDGIVYGVFGDGTGLMRISASGGSVETLTLPEPGSAHVFPDVLPDGRGILFTISSGRGTQSIGVLDAITSEWKPLVPEASAAQYVPATGHILYATQNSVFAAPFDLDRLELTGEARPVLNDVEVRPANGSADFSVSRNGMLLYLRQGRSPGSSSRDTTPSMLFWAGTEGDISTTDTPPDFYDAARISPDGSKLVAAMGGDIFVWNMGTSTSWSRLTWDDAVDGYPAWRPDSLTVVFVSDRDGMENLYQKRVDGTGAAAPLIPAGRFGRVEPFLRMLPDGREALIWREVVSSYTGQLIWDVYAQILDGGSEPEVLIQNGGMNMSATLSPDGRWLAYVSRERGPRFALFVRPYPDVEGGMWEFPGANAASTGWSPDGSELRYVEFSDDRSSVRLMRIPVKRGSLPSGWGSPETLLELGQPREVMDLEGDGRILLNRPIERPVDAALNSDDPADEPAEVILVQNWFEELKERVPVN